MKKKPLATFVNKENLKIKKMNKIVADAIKNNENITQTLLETNTNNLTLGQKMADGVASFG
ncbi:MAG: hypothetical protein WCP92_00590 [bacterium]